MKIAVDAMGGDLAPFEIVKGVIQAAREGIADFLLFGDQSAISSLFPDLPANISIIHTQEYIAMDEPPTLSLKKKPNASVCLAAKAVREGKAQALISAGNTGALLESALLFMGRIPGIKRPAIATFLPTRKQPAILLDSGANVDCKPEFLLQFAGMGAAYAQKIMGRENPKVALLNIGEEEGKGDLLCQEAFKLLKASSLNFTGNLEIRDFLAGRVDVGVCDGLVGNFILKTAESAAEFLFLELKSAISQKLFTRLCAFFLKPAFKQVKDKLDQAEYGGAPLLGVKGVCIKSHGRANARAIYNAARFAVKAVDLNLVETISGL